MTVAWAADDVHAGVAVATVQWRERGTWRTLASERASDGSGNMVVDVSALPNGDRRRSGSSSRTPPGTSRRSPPRPEISGAGVGSDASDPLGRLRAARLAVSLAGARPERRDGRVVLVRRIAAGRTVIVQGALLDRRRRPIVGAEVQARGYRGRLVGRGLTRSGGRFAFLLRPVGGARGPDRGRERPRAPAAPPARRPAHSRCSRGSRSRRRRPPSRREERCSSADGSPRRPASSGSARASRSCSSGSTPCGARLAPGRERAPAPRRDLRDPVDVQRPRT